ncbi:MAG TPA: hypothetical protein VFD71_07295 [Planctomycetota bacterium]|jgi:hypothetical protein|nr:hypothetical protein [Planctomycetota bacterium]
MAFSSGSFTTRPLSGYARAVAWIQKTAPAVDRCLRRRWVQAVIFAAAFFAAWIAGGKTAHAGVELLLLLR